MKVTWAAFLAAFLGALTASIIFTVGFKLLFTEKIHSDGTKKTTASFLGSDQSEK
jgi:hypothetical protein